MKKYKSFLVIVSIFLGLILCNLGYFFITNWQTLFKAKTSSSSANKTIDLKKYSSSKIGFEAEYPALWIVKDSGDTVEINPPSAGVSTYFSVGLRNDFKSLDEVKRRLATDIPITPTQVSDAPGFKYTDTDYRDVIWLLHSSKIYVIRIYPMNEGAKQILSTFKFKD